MLVPFPAGFLPVALLTALAIILGVLVGGEIARRDIKSWVHSIADRQLQHERNTIIATISSLISALEARDPCTRNHSTRVAKLAVRLAKEMGLRRAEQYEIHLGGLLHDVGKIGIPDAILLKPGGLTLEEYEVMKSHSILGARILSGIPGLEAVGNIVLTHHEMFDGNGYPDGIAGEEIPMGARIIAVCDTYMSMTEDRPYRDAQTLDAVMCELHRVAGRQLDPNVVDALARLLHLEIEKFGSPIAGFSPSNGTASDKRVA
jgi:putative nucleotidyltransferase with HDIG domain